LKEKEAGRANEISKLFNLEPYNIHIEKKSKLLNNIRPIVRDYDALIKETERVIKQL
jgi:hypothetical protein